MVPDLRQTVAPRAPDLTQHGGKLDIEVTGSDRHGTGANWGQRDRF